MFLSFRPRCWCFYLFVSIPSLPSYWWILSVLSLCMIIENLIFLMLPSFTISVSGKKAGWGWEMGINESRGEGNILELMEREKTREKEWKHWRETWKGWMRDDRQHMGNQTREEIIRDKLLSKRVWWEMLRDGGGMKNKMWDERDEKEGK